MRKTKTAAKPKQLQTFADLKAIDKGIARVRGVFGNANELVHALAVAILVHDKEHGDCTRALELVKSIPNRNQPDLVKWFGFYGNIGMDVKNDKVRHIAKDSKTFNDTPTDKLIEQARVKPWYDAASVPGNAPTIVPITLGSINADILSMTDRLRKRINGETTSDKRPLQLTKKERETALGELDKIDELVRATTKPEEREQRRPSPTANAA